MRHVCKAAIAQDPESVTSKPYSAATIFTAVFLCLFMSVSPVNAEGDFAGLSVKASIGDPASQYILGSLYREGKEVPKDAAQAFAWISQAANDGNPEAQYALGQMYSRGEGCATDYVLAYQWFFLAAKMGQEGAFAAGGDVSEMMTLEELNQSQSQAYAWLARRQASDQRVAGSSVTTH